MSQNACKKASIQPPYAMKIKKKLTQHGHTRIDNYYWMNKRDNDTVINYLNAENEYFEKKMKHTENYQKKLYDEMVGRIKKDDTSVPFRYNGYYYYTRVENTQEYPLYCRKKNSLDAKEEVMLDVPEMAKDYDYYRIGDYAVSSNNNILAYSVDTESRRKYTIYFKDLKTGKIYIDKIPNTSGSIVWANDNKTIFYTKKHKQTLLPYQVYKHELGIDVKNDKLVYEEKDNTFYTFCFKTKSEKYIVIGNESTLTSEYRFIDASKPNNRFKIFHPRERGIEYSIEHYENHFYIVTNWKAKNFCLMKTSIFRTNKKYWKIVIPHRDNVLLSNIEIFKDYLVIEERKNALNHIRILSWDLKKDHYLKFDEDVYDAWISTNPEFENKYLRFGYISLTTPKSIYDFDLETKEKKLLKETEVLGDFDKKNYITKRFWAKSKDNALVPISIVYHKDTKLDGTAPLYITGYGAYGYSYDVNFSSVRLSLLNRGFVYAIAHIRGGQEMGRYWYEDGKLLKKKNTFFDFIYCTKYFIDNQLVDKNKIFASGGSAGGLLIGAILNMNPKLYCGTIANVPFVDVVSTMLDESIPLTTGEFDEWGNPKQKKYYDYMLSYSPYDNVKAQDYPAMLVTTGYHDSQVQYWEPAKWVAKLRDYKTDDNPLLFKVEMKSGHSGVSGRLKKLKEIALEYSYVFDILGINK